jgi:trk system potassium uptake protein TrkA
MRIIIAGGGEIGFQIAQELAGQRDIVVIEEDPVVASRFERLDLHFIRGSPIQPEKLRSANLTESDKFIACSESDEKNIIACLSAKRLGDPQTYCLVSKADYFHSFQARDGDESVLTIDRVIWPQQMLAEEIARIVLVPRAIDVEVFASGRIRLLEYRLHPSSHLLRKPLSQLNLPRGVLAVAVTHADNLYIPSGNSMLHEGDKVVFMGEDKALLKLQRDFIVDSQQKVEQVAIIGGGTVGLTLAKILQASGKLELKIIEKSGHRCELLAAELPSALVLHGDGTDLELLEAEQLYRSDAFVSVTTNDEKNLLSSLLARQMKVPKIITRVDKPANIRLFESVGIDVPINMRVTAIESVINTLQDTNIQLLATVEGGKADVLELEVPASYPTTKLINMPRIEGAIIGAIVRKNQIIVPHGEDTVRAGDHLFVFSMDQSSQAVREYF